MLDLLLFDKKKNERDFLLNEVSNSLAFLTDDFVRKDVYSSLDNAFERIKEERPCDMAILEITNNDEIMLSKSFRKRYDSSDLMLVVNQMISPMDYLVPEIRATSLILRPTSVQKAKAAVKSFIRYFFENQKENKEAGFLLETKGSKTSIPYSKIFYFEVRGKRTFIRLRDKEYSMYQSLDSIKETIPDFFIQCHRSFVINSRFIDKIKLSENTIEMIDGVIVPLSRSFKKDIKGFINGIKNG